MVDSTVSLPNDHRNTMFARLLSSPSAQAVRRVFALMLVFVVTLAPAAFAQEDEDEKPKPQKEWVVGYALVTLPMAAAMYFMFRANKRHDFKLKKADGEE